MKVIIKDKNNAYLDREAEVTHSDPRGIYLVRIPTGTGSVSFAVRESETEPVNETGADL